MQVNNAPKASTKRLILLASLVEIAMGICFYPITLLQSINSILCPIIQYLFQAIHIALLVSVITLALSSAHKAEKGAGYRLILLFHLALFLKDFIGTSISNIVNYSGSFTPFEGVLLAFFETFVNTGIVMGISLLVLYFAPWLLFVKKCSGSPIPYAPEAPRTDALSRSALLVTVLVTVVNVLYLVPDSIEFGESNFWLLTAKEWANMIFDLFFPILAGILAYLFTAQVRKRFFSDTVS